VDRYRCPCVLSVRIHSLLELAREDLFARATLLKELLQVEVFLLIGSQGPVHAVTFHLPVYVPESGSLLLHRIRARVIATTALHTLYEEGGEAHEGNNA